MDREVMDAHGQFLMDYGKKNGIIFRLSRSTFSIEDVSAEAEAIKKRSK